MPDTRPDPLSALLHDVLNDDRACIHSPENEWEPLCEELAREAGVTLTQPQPDADRDKAAIRSLERQLSDCQHNLDKALRDTQPQPDAGLREAAQAHADATHSDDNHTEVIATLIALRAALRSIPAAPLDVERLGEAVFRVGTGYRNRDLALIHPRIANSQDGAKASGEFAEAIAREYAALRSTPAAPKEDDRG